jgi:LCP family protein required for cell wall assembly
MEKLRIPIEKLILALLLISISLFIFFSSTGKVFRFIRQGKRINILILGCDELEFAKHADVIMLLSYEPRTRFLDVLSIPRDTKVPCSKELSWRGYRKISEIYAMVYKKSKAIHEACLSSKKAIEDVLEMEMPFYLQINYQGVVDIVDAIGGMMVDIDEPMDYDDEEGDLHIHFTVGEKRLNGNEVLKYVRFRESILGDRGRIERQQRLLKLLTGKMRDAKILLKFPQIYSNVRGNIWTNLSFWDFLALANEVRDFDYQNLRVQSLPGKSEHIRGVDYWVLDEEMAGEIVEVIMNSYRVGRKAYRPVYSGEKLDRIVKVEIWNATNRKDLAYNVQRRLRQYGIDAVRWGNFGICKKYTTVIDRHGDIELAYKVARILGSSGVKTEIDKTRFVDLSIVLGDDFMEFSEPE